MRKKHQVHLIQTYGPVHYGIWKGIDNKLFYMQGITSAQRPNIPQHLYFTSGEEIQAEKLEEELKNGCIFISQNGIVKVLTNHRVKAIGNYYKIVATNNPDLWTIPCVYPKCGGYQNHGQGNCGECKKGIAKIPSDFAEEYVNKEGNIKEVELEIENKVSYEQETDSIIWKLKLNSDGTVIIHNIEEKMYTREEVLGVILTYTTKDVLRYTLEHYQAIAKDIKQWFDQNHPK